MKLRRPKLGLPDLSLPDLSLPKRRLSTRGLHRLEPARDPGVQAVLVLAALAIVAFAMLAFAWRGGARTPYVPLQLPWFVSGGIAGLALLGMALGAWSIHLGRRQDAVHRAATEELVREAAELAENVRTGQVTLPRHRH